MSLLADTVLMCWSLALIWSMDHAGANYHLLTYTSWPRHSGLFSITSPEIRLQPSFLFLLRRTAWLRLHQVRSIMCDWRKCQPVIFPTALIAGSRTQTSEAEWVSCNTFHTESLVMFSTLFCRSLQLYNHRIKWIQTFYLLIWICCEVFILPSSLLFFIP